MTEKMHDDTPFHEVVGEDHLGTRLYNVLRREGVSTVGQLRKISDDDVARLPNIGVATMRRLAEVRKKIG